MCGNAALWLVEAALLEANPGVRARKLLASQPQYTIDDDPFIKLELLLASQLATSYGAKGAEAKRVLEEALRPPIDPDAVTAAVKKIGDILGDPIDDVTQIHIEQYINDLMAAGAQDAVDTVDTTDTETETEDDAGDTGGGKNPSAFGPIVTAFLITGLLSQGGSPEVVPELKKVFSTMVDGIKYYSNKQISAVVLPSINDAVQTWLEDNAIGNENDGTDIPGVGGLLAELNDNFELDSYWRTVANTSASRAYHYGLFKAGEELGASSFMVVNPLDERTSEICQYLFGKVFPLTNAVDDIESTSNDNITPFLDPADVVGASDEELIAMGISTPPYHFNCRSWAVLTNS